MSTSNDNLLMQLGRAHIEIEELRDRVKSLEETERNRDNWIRLMKDRLGYSQNVSFDTVIEDLIAGRHLDDDTLKNILENRV